MRFGKRSEIVTTREEAERPLMVIDSQYGSDFRQAVFQLLQPYSRNSLARIGDIRCCIVESKNKVGVTGLAKI